MNGGAWGIRNRGGGSYNPDCDFCDECGRYGHDPEGCPGGPVRAAYQKRLLAEKEKRAAEEAAKPKFRKGGLLRYLWCIAFHTRYHVQMGADVGFGVYCQKCDVKW